MLTALVYLVAILLGVNADVQNALSEKEIVRAEFNQFIDDNINRTNLVSACLNPLTTIQIKFATDKIQELLRCVSIIADALFDRLDDGITKADFQDSSQARKFIPHICDLFGDGFQCALNFEPVFDLCLNLDDRQTKRNIFALAPIIHESVCIQNGTFLSDVAEHEDSLRCVYMTYDLLMANGLTELLISTSSDLFGSETNCREFARLQTLAIDEVFSCSDTTEKFPPLKHLIGNFCRQTKCQHFISDLQCFG